MELDDDSSSNLNSEDTHVNLDESEEEEVKQRDCNPITVTIQHLEQEHFTQDPTKTGELPEIETSTSRVQENTMTYEATAIAGW